MDDEGPVAFRIFNPDRTDAVVDSVARLSDALPLSWVVCSIHADGLSPVCILGWIATAAMGAATVWMFIPGQT
jgi:hypothetical protein